jgi:hypothetical protein
MARDFTNDIMERKTEIELNHVVSSMARLELD